MGKQASAQVKSEHRQLLVTADSIFRLGDYINAKAYYQYFTQLYPGNETAKTRLEASIKLIREEREQRIIYSDFIIKADDLCKGGLLEEAITSYQEALKLFSFERYPAQQISQIKNKMSENELIRKEFDAVIEMANTYFSEGDYKNAKVEYQFAISLLPNEEYPKNKLIEANKLIADKSFMLEIYEQTLTKADSLFLIRDYKNALETYQRASDLQPREDYPKTQIAQLNLLLNPLEAYNGLLLQADNFYMVRDFVNAKKLYETAAQTKPADAYPAEMLSKVNQALANKATTDQEDYLNAIQQGDDYFASGEYLEAQNQFEFAKRLKPNEDYSIRQLEILSGILDSIQSADALSLQYAELINKADVFFSASELKKAQEIYEQAIDLKPGDSYPLEKLRKIKNTFKALEDQKNLEQNYANAIAKAETLLTAKNYASAKSEFQFASRLKEDERYPKLKINEIDSIQAQIEAVQTAEENYVNTIKEADELFEQQKFGNAQIAYKKALNYKPDEAYPNTRLKEITDIFALQRDELNRAYDLAVLNAKNAMAKNQLQIAKTYLNEALTLKPEEPYPAITILQIDTQIAESKARALLQYEPLLKEADQYFNQKAYDRALSFYYQASVLLPNEIYPPTRIKEILEIIHGAATYEILNTDLELENNELKKYNFEPIPITDRRSNYFLLKLKNIDDARNFKIFFNYGKDDQKNGGLIIRLNKTTDSNYYLIRVGGLYKWFSENNNWVSIQPEGGKLEISEISISKIN